MAKSRAATGKATKSVEAADQEFIEHLRQMAEFRFREERERARRVAAAARQRRRLLGHLAKKLGIALGQFDALHEADWKLVQHQAKAQEKAAIALLKRQHARQRAAFRNVLKHRGRFDERRSQRRRWAFFNSLLVQGGRGSPHPSPAFRLDRLFILTVPSHVGGGRAREGSLCCVRSLEQTKNALGIR